MTNEPSTAKSERLNLRVSPDALTLIREAAALHQQDLTSFVLGAAMERARAVLAEERVLKLGPDAVLQLERMLDREPEVIPQLAALFRKYGAGAETTRGEANREQVKS